MYSFSFQPLFYVQIQEKGSVKDQKYLNAMIVNINVIFYNLIHVSSKETVNPHSQQVNFHKGQSIYRTSQK